MNYLGKNLRTFIGAKDFNQSRKFYNELGFEEVVISKGLVLFKVNENLGFYLQDYFVKKWVHNSMIFLEVDDVEKCYEDLKSRNLPEKYKYARLTPIKKFDEGRECFLHDPSGVLWHFCQLD